MVIANSMPTLGSERATGENVTSEPVLDPVTVEGVGFPDAVDGAGASAGSKEHGTIIGAGTDDCDCTLWGAGIGIPH